MRLLRNTVCALIATAALVDGAAATVLQYHVIPTSLTSMAANVTLVEGDKDALLIDVPFSRADAYRVVAEILDSGKTLKTIFITHDHPDHFFGLDVLNDAFPGAAVVANETVAKDMKRSIPIKFKRWSPLLGANAPHREVYPTALAGSSLDLEGHALKVLGPMQGDHVHATAVWDAETGTLVAGDLVFNQVFPWLGEHLDPQYKAWIMALDTLAALHPRRIVAGHTKPGLSDDSYAIDWTRSYIVNFAAAAKDAKSSASLAEQIHALYPTTIDVADGFLVGVSSKVATGEIKPWDE